jgi:hypothetical protein
MITSSNPSGGTDLTFCSDLLLTARGGCTLIEFACLVTDACIAGRPVRFELLSRGIAIARDMFAISRE